MTIATRGDPDHDRLRRVAVEPDDQVGPLQGSVPAEPAIRAQRKGRSVHRYGRGPIAQFLRTRAGFTSGDFALAPISIVAASALSPFFSIT